jgi:hypothetical protein
MSREITKGASGIYEIRCITTGKLYIGSAVRLNDRWRKHRYDLDRGKHKNAHLQAAWDKYRSDSFVFTILEYVEREALLAAEQRWIDETQCADRSKGYNLYPIAGSPGQKNARVWSGFVNPEGEEVEIFNLYAFCRENELDYPSMLRLFSGRHKLRSYKGWTHRGNPRKREYVKTYDGFIHPTGVRIAPVTNLAAFCRRHGLEPSHMVALTRGRLRSHRGWRHVNSRERRGGPKTYDGFVDPNGNSTVITNLRAFCNDLGLAESHMRQLVSGKRKSHKGWTWRNSR